MYFEQEQLDEQSYFSRTDERTHTGFQKIPKQDDDGDDDLSLQQLIEQQAQKTPDALALQSGREQITYQEVNRRANQLARFLNVRGVGPETIVGIYMYHSSEAVIAMLGVLKAGGAYLPLDPTYPIERIGFILRDAKVKLLLTQNYQRDRFAGHDVEIIALTEESGRIREENQENLTCRISGRNLAYIIYTSGSTGHPKGVQIEHRSLLNLVHWHRSAFAISASDRAGLVASFSFDASVWGLWPYLASGASFHLPDQDEMRVAANVLCEWIVAQHITIGFFPPSLAECLLELEWPEDASFRLLLTGGDKLYRYPRSSLPFQVVNNYGTTENTVVATSGMIQPVKAPDTLPSIGYPISNMYVYILDDALQVVPREKPGELYIGGVGLARGYFHHPEWTAERFCPDPFSSSPGARLYRTGDRVCWQKDHSIRFLGRVDQQIKVRGFRVEPGEIETLLNASAKVQGCVVVGRERGQGDTAIVAYIVPRRGIEIADIDDELHNYLAEALPAHMLPSKYMIIDALPLSANGKVDAKELPEPDWKAISEYNAHEAEDLLTPLEKDLCKIWCQILKVEQVRGGENFFKSGGHSLSVVQLLLLIRNTFGVSLSMREIFDAPTLTQMARSIADKRDKNHQDQTQ